MGPIQAYHKYEVDLDWPPGRLPEISGIWPEIQGNFRQAAGGLPEIAAGVSGPICLV